MTEILIEVKTVIDEEGRVHQFSYYRLEEGGSYGVCIKSREKAAAMVPGITASRRRINTLLNALIRGSVSPTEMREVVEDWLAVM